MNRGSRRSRGLCWRDFWLAAWLLSAGVGVSVAGDQGVDPRAALEAAVVAGDPIASEAAAHAVLAGSAAEALRARAWIELSRAAARRQDGLGAEREALAALASARSVGDTAVEGAALTQLGAASVIKGRPDDASEALRQAQPLLDDAEVPLSNLTWLMISSALAGLRGDRAATLDLTERGITVARALERHAAVAMFLLNRSKALTDLRDADELQKTFAQALVAARIAARADLEAAALIALATEANSREQWANAQDYGSQAAALARQMGSPVVATWAKAALANALRGTGKWIQAATLQQEVVAEFTAAQVDDSLIAAERRLAEISAQLGRWQFAYEAQLRSQAAQDRFRAQVSRAQDQAQEQKIASLQATIDQQVGMLDQRQNALDQANAVNRGLQIWRSGLAAALLVLVGLGVLGLLGRRQRSRVDRHAGAAQTLALARREMRDPIHAISAFSELLARSTDDEGQLQLVWAVQRSAETLTRLADDFEQRARLQQGQGRARPVPTVLEDLCTQIAQAKRPILHEQGVELAVHIALGLPNSLRIDAAKVTQVVVRFIELSLRFGECASVSLHVINGVRGEGWIRFLVAESGRLFTPAERQQFFRPITSPAPTRPRLDGQTLAFAVCEDLAALLGGEVGHEVVDDGSLRFWLEVPAVPADGLKARVVEAGATPDNSQSRMESMLEKLRVMVVDDDPVGLHVTMSQARALGCEVSGTTSPVEALIALREQPCQVVVLDFVMPEMPGDALARAIRKSSSDGPAVRLVMLSSEVEPNDPDRSWFDLWLQKPITLAQLGAALQLGHPDSAPVAKASRVAAISQAVVDASASAAQSLSRFPVLDDAVIEELAALAINGKPAIYTLIAQFRTHLPDQLLMLRRGAKEGEVVLVLRVAHRLKGTAGALGCVRLAEATRMLEEQTRAASVDGVLALASAVELIAQRSLDELSARWSEP